MFAVREPHPFGYLCSCPCGAAACSAACCGIRGLETNGCSRTSCQSCRFCQRCPSNGCLSCAAHRLGGCATPSPLAVSPLPACPGQLAGSASVIGVSLLGEVVASPPQADMLTSLSALGCASLAVSADLLTMHDCVSTQSPRRLRGRPLTHTHTPGRRNKPALPMNQPP